MCECVCVDWTLRTIIIALPGGGNSIWGNGGRDDNSQFGPDHPLMKWRAKSSQPARGGEELSSSSIKKKTIWISKVLDCICICSSVISLGFYLFRKIGEFWCAFSISPIVFRRHMSLVSPPFSWLFRPTCIERKSESHLNIPSLKVYAHIQYFVLLTSLFTPQYTSHHFHHFFSGIRVNRVFPFFLFLSLFHATLSRHA